jgi:2'-5' RNA ligase
VIRSFMAVNPNLGVLRRVSEVQRALRGRSRVDGWDVKWIAPPNLHVVVRYLGEVGEALPPSLADALTPQVRPLPPFPLRARGLRMPDGEGRPARVVVGLEDPEEGLAALCRALQEPLDRIGFKLEAPPPAPELVVGRVRTPGQTPLLVLASDAAEADFGESLVTELLAYRSDVVVPGSEFDCLLRIRLSGRRPQRAGSRESAEAPAAEPPVPEAVDGFEEPRTGGEPPSPGEPEELEREQREAPPSDQEA